MVGSRPDLLDNTPNTNSHVLGIINGWALVLRNQSDGAPWKTARVSWGETCTVPSSYRKYRLLIEKSADERRLVRAFLLAQSARVLQDDSGIPVRYFAPEKCVSGGQQAMARALGCARTGSMR